MASRNTSSPDVSNGTCYFGQNSVTKGDFIPCGNVAYGDWPCCHVGSVCLDFEKSNACWDPETGNTYLAGCTDSGFYAKSCPWKSLEFNRQEWVAIQHCSDETDENGNMDWGGCKVSDNSTELEVLPHASCDPYCSSSPLVVGPSNLVAYATVPASAGGSITWTNGFDPVTRSMPSTTPTSSPTPTSPTSQSPTSTSTPTSTTTPEDDGLTVGERVGIGIGAAAAGLLIVAVALLTLLVRRRRRKNGSQSNLSGTDPYAMPPGLGEADQADARHNSSSVGAPSPMQEQWQYSGSPKPYAWIDAATTPNNHGPYTGFKSELPANDIGAELPADHPHGGLGEQTTQPDQNAYLRVNSAPTTTIALSPRSFERTSDAATTIFSNSTVAQQPQGGSHQQSLVSVSPQSTGTQSQQQQSYRHSPGGGVRSFQELQG